MYGAAIEAVRARGGTTVSTLRSPQVIRPTLSCCWMIRYASAARQRPPYSSLLMPPPPEKLIDADASSTR